MASKAGRRMAPRRRWDRIPCWFKGTSTEWMQREFWRLEMGPTASALATRFPPRLEARLRARATSFPGTLVMEFTRFRVPDPSWASQFKGTRLVQMGAVESAWRMAG